MCTDQSSVHIDCSVHAVFVHSGTISATPKLRVHQISGVVVPTRNAAWRALCGQFVPMFQIPAYLGFCRRVVLAFRVCTVTSISSTFTSYRQHVAKVGVGKSVRHTSSVSTRSRGWHSHEDYCAQGSLRNLFSRVTGPLYKEFYRRMVFVSLLYTGHPSVRHPSRSNT